MKAGARALLAGLAAAAIGLDAASAAQPQTSPWGAQTVQQPVTAVPSVCQAPPTQPPLTYDKNMCCKRPDTWQQACLDWADQAGKPAQCLDPVYICRAPAAPGH